MRNEERLKQLIDEAVGTNGMMSSEKLALYLAERGVKAMAVSAKIGDTVWSFRAETPRASGGMASTYVVSGCHLDYLLKSGVVVYVAEKFFVKSDEAKLGTLVFLTKKEAEAKLKEKQEGK